MNREVYSTRVRAKLDALQAKKHAAELKVRTIDRQIEELLVGQSPIWIGSRIVWVSANRERYGTVTSISTAYRGFSYRVTVTTKAGHPIGAATVDESQQPTLRND